PKVGPDSSAKARSTRANRQQHFLAEGILEIFELERRLTLVAQNFEYGRAALLGHFNAPIFQMDDLHLQRLDPEVPVIAAMWTGQRHERLPSEAPFGALSKG